jgi:hypothetical protein
MILFLALWIIFIILVFYWIHEDFWKPISAIISVMLAFVIAGIVSLVMGGLVTVFADVQSYETESVELIALKDNLGVNGNYFLFSGNVNSEMQYTFLANEPEGITMKTISVKDYKCYIKYTDGQPYMTTNVYKFTDPILQKLLPCAKNSYYTFYIPEGSIADNAFLIDLE